MRESLDGAMTFIAKSTLFFRLLACFMLALVACGRAASGPCATFLTQATWEVSMASPDGNRLEGEVRVVNGVRRLVGVATSPEDAREPLDYPLDSLTVRGDSIRFRFAPASVLVEGKCIDGTRIQSRYVEDLRPSFSLIQGVGELRRKS